MRAYNRIGEDGSKSLGPLLIFIANSEGGQIYTPEFRGQILYTPNLDIYRMPRIQGQIYTPGFGHIPDTPDFTGRYQIYTGYPRFYGQILDIYPRIWRMDIYRIPPNLLKIRRRPLLKFRGKHWTDSSSLQSVQSTENIRIYQSSCNKMFRRN